VVRRSRPPRGGDVGDEEGDGGGRVPRKNGSGCWRGEGRMRDWSGRTGRGGGGRADDWRNDVPSFSCKFFLFRSRDYKTAPTNAQVALATVIPRSITFTTCPTSCHS
jgi:hypothetical protein